jgi:hypothetical protein
MTIPTIPPQSDNFNRQFPPTIPQQPPFSQPGSYLPGPHGPPPPPKPPKKRHPVLLILAGAAVALLLIVVIAGTLAGSSKKAGSSSSPSKPTSHPAAQPSQATANQAFYKDIQSQFPALAVAGATKVVSLGHSVCNARGRGVGQANLISVINKNNTFGINAQSFVRLAETDLCPAALAPVIKVKPHVIARFSGSGIQNTARFTIRGSGNWVLKWSYNCSNFGLSGNFIVSEDNMGDFNGASVNELGMSGHGQTHVYGDSGRHYLSVNSECNWKTAVVTAP